MRTLTRGLRECGNAWGYVTWPGHYQIGGATYYTVGSGWNSTTNRVGTLGSSESQSNLTDTHSASTTILTWVSEQVSSRSGYYRAFA